MCGCSPGSSATPQSGDCCLNAPEGEWVDEPVPGIRSDRFSATRTRLKTLFLDPVLDVAASAVDQAMRS